MVDMVTDAADLYQATVIAERLDSAEDMLNSAINFYQNHECTLGNTEIGILREIRDGVHDLKERIDHEIGEYLETAR